MIGADEEDIACPRCGYNLRGLTVPRCPECGLRFAEEAWQRGEIREHVATSLDRCDPWQPHQVLLRSLWELSRAVLRPSRLLTKLDLNGRVWPAGLMFVFGGAWVYVIAVGLVATAMCLHVGTSPYASVKAAAGQWVPRALLATLALGLASCGLLVVPGALHVRTPRMRQVCRVAGYWVPAMMAYALLVPAALLVVVPAYAAGAPKSIGMLIALAVSLGSWASVVLRGRPLLSEPDTPGGSRPVRAILFAWACLVVGLVVCGALFPKTLDLP